MPRALQLKRRFAQLMDLPPEAVLNTALIKVVGNLELSIANHRGLREFSAGAICVASPQGLIRVTGTGLVIHYLSPDEVRIGGRITGIDLE